MFKTTTISITQPPERRPNHVRPARRSLSSSTTPEPASRASSTPASPPSPPSSTTPAPSSPPPAPAPPSPSHRRPLPPPPRRRRSRPHRRLLLGFFHVVNHPPPPPLSSPAPSPPSGPSTTSPPPSDRPTTPPERRRRLLRLQLRPLPLPAPPPGATPSRSPGPRASPTRAGSPGVPPRAGRARGGGEGSRENCHGAAGRGAGGGERPAGGDDVPGGEADGVPLLPLVPRAGADEGPRGAHRSGVVTLRRRRRVGGLQVKWEGEDGQCRWVDVEPVEGALLVNVGDLLQMISNDEYKSVEHRVVANSHKEGRVSIAVFFNPGKRGETDLYGPLPELVSPEKTCSLSKFHNVGVPGNLLQERIGQQVPGGLLQVIEEHWAANV
ncbi:1-aminocyclopropane-1-carboxylate oxidase-like protein 3-like [Iris pallida]|uniref:1-aminocyclopropane-1-carboxylate oxidase-like protein 3-like n=1 Tax=Iris pallida TaxID=29817 RepID=A0AAX6GE61_IRIPA|nr:1-aminocyclopropane-1-carboxylate oxidase-like protein 3-like [Iris pallida]